MAFTEAQFNGFFDADGSIRLGVNVRKSSKTENYKISFQVDFCITQVSKNKDILDETINLFKLKRRVASTKRKNNLIEFKLIVPSRTTDGQILINHFNRNNPILPSRRRDYFIAVKMLGILGIKRRVLSTINKVFLTYLCYGNSSQITTSSVIKKEPIDIIFQKLNITAAEQEAGKKLAFEFLTDLELKLKNYKDSLNQIILSKEYMVGFYIGDGTLGVSFQHNKLLKTASLGFYWGIVDPDKEFLTCFKKSINCGRIAGAGKIPGNCYELSVTIIREINKKILPILDTSYLPSGRKKQLDTFKQIVSLETNPTLRLESNNWEKIIDLAFSMSFNSGRKYSKEELLILGNRRIENIKNKNSNIKNNKFIIKKPIEI
jgi:hypothetical protein